MKVVWLCDVCVVVVEVVECCFDCIVDFCVVVFVCELVDCVVVE